MLLPSSLSREIYREAYDNSCLKPLSFKIISYQFPYFLLFNICDLRFAVPLKILFSYVCKGQENETCHILLLIFKYIYVQKTIRIENLHQNY